MPSLRPAAALPRPAAPAPISTREILVLFLPLAATSTMMSASVPIVNAGLARHPDPEANLAAFGLAFALGILLESPVFALQQAAVAWYGGSGRIAPLLAYSTGVGLAVTAVKAAVAFTPLAPFILARLMGAGEELAVPAAAALRVAVVFPTLIAVRSALQGILLGRRRAGPIGTGTLLRLGTLAVLILGVGPRAGWTGPSAAMACLAAAIVVETIFVGLCVPRTPERPGGTSPAQEAGRSFAGRTRFVLPLMGMMALGTLTNPLINAIIARSGDRETGLAAYSVIASLVWFLASPFLRYSSVTIALGTTPENLRRLSRFVRRTVGGITALIVLAHLTPLFPTFLTGAMGLGVGLAGAVHAPLVALSLQPLLAAHIAYSQGVLTRGARTRAVGLGGVARVAAILLGGGVGLAAGLSGAVLGAALLGLSFAAELALLAAARRRSRVGDRVGPGGEAAGASA